MRKRTILNWNMVLLVVLALALAACGSDGESADTDPATTDAPPATEGTDGTDSTEVDDTDTDTTEDMGSDGEGTTITYAVSGDPAAESLPGLYALDQLAEKYGYETEVVATPETSILVEGVSTGEFTIGEGATTAIMNAINQGAELKIIGSEANMNWTMAAPPDVETCADLGGLRLGLHAVGSAGEGYYNYWASENCTEEEREAIEILYVAGSDSRVQALLAGELDAGMVTTAEIPLVQPEYDLMIDFADVLQGRVLAWPLFVSSELLESDPQLVQRFMEEVVAIQRQLAEDQDLNAQLLDEYFDSFDQEAAEQAAQIAFETNLYPDDAGLSSLENIDSIVEFYVESTGELEPSSLDDPGVYVDTGPVTEAIEQVG